MCDVEKNSYPNPENRNRLALDRLGVCVYRGAQGTCDVSVQ